MLEFHQLDMSPVVDCSEVWYSQVHRNQESTRLWNSWSCEICCGIQRTSSPLWSLLQVGGCPGQSTDCLLCMGVRSPQLLWRTEFSPIEAGKTCSVPWKKYKLTVHTVKSVFETGKGFSVTPSSAAGPWPNVVLISLNGQVLGDIAQSVKKYAAFSGLGILGLVSSDAPNGLMVQRNLVSHLPSPVLSQLMFLNGRSSQHTGTNWSALVTSLSGTTHSAHSPVGLV